MTTLITEMSHTIGQMKEEFADAQVERMNKQTKRKWSKSYEDQMYLTDETDDNVNNPCIRQEGCCFVTMDNYVENW